MLTTIVVSNLLKQSNKFHHDIVRLLIAKPRQSRVLWTVLFSADRPDHLDNPACDESREAVRVFRPTGSGAGAWKLLEL